MKKKVLGTAIITGTLILAACSPGATDANNNTLRNNCQNWKKEKHGEEKCIDRSSNYYGHYLFNGMHYGNRSSLENSNAYKSALNGTTSGNNSGTQNKGESSKGNNNGTQNNGTNNSKASQNGKGGTNNGGLKGGFGSGSKGSGAS